MLKIIAAAVVLVSLTQPAEAGSEIEKRCGTKVTWSSVKCGWRTGYTARSHDVKAAEYETRAKHAEIDGRMDKAEDYRRLATYEAARAEAIRKRYPKQ